MDKKIIWAGLAGALAITGVAIAQTPAATDQPADQSAAPPASSATTPSAQDNSATQPSTSSTPSAGSYSSDTAATTSDQGTATDRAGERG